MRTRFPQAIMLAGTLALAGCNGWPPADEYAAAQVAPEKYPGYAATPEAEAQTFTFEHRRYMILPAPEQLRGVKLQQIGSAGITGIFAQSGVTAPYSVLYTQAEGGKWRKVVPID